MKNSVLGMRSVECELVVHLLNPEFSIQHSAFTKRLSVMDSLL